jgi:hypothetical protein
MGDTLKIIVAVLTSAAWYPFFSFLNSCCRSCQIYIGHMNSIGVLGKVLFTIFMFFLGFGLFGLIFCLAGCIDIWGEPCNKY